MRLAKSQDGQTGLILAAQNGHEEVVRLLLEHGAEAKAADKVPSAREDGLVSVHASVTRE